MNTSKLIIRHVTESDLKQMLKLFAETVATVCKTDYSEEQIRVWTDSAKNIDRWKDKMLLQYFLIAELDGIMVGFASLEGRDYLDLLYVHKDFQRKGIADKLYVAIESEAKRRGAESLTSDVSITAVSFFVKQGFEKIRLQTQLIQSVEISNYKMIKRL